MLANPACESLQFKVVAEFRVRHASRQAHAIFAFRANTGVVLAKADRHVSKLDLGDLTSHPRCKMRHRMPVHRQLCPILFGCQIGGLAGTLLTEERLQPEYVRSISDRRAFWNLLVQRHGTMSFARKEPTRY